MGFEKYWDQLKKIVNEHPKKKPLDKNGNFYPDPTPMAPPVNVAPDIDMFERMRSIVRRELSQAAKSGEFETFEEADDFDVGDDYEPFSPYELIVEQQEPDGPVLNPDPTQGTPSDAPSLKPGNPPEGGGPPGYSGGCP